LDAVETTEVELHRAMFPERGDHGGGHTNVRESTDRRRPFCVCSTVESSVF